jgi:hypothetical protein
VDKRENISDRRGVRRQFWLTAVSLALVVCAGVARLNARQIDAPASSKLAAVLADLAGAVTQEAGPAPALRVKPPGFSLAAMPNSVRDAARARLLRINDHGEVQVYLLMDAVTDERLGALEAQGVAVDFTDPAGGRVQARLPASRLEAVAGLPFVRLIRLPNYAVRMSGSVTTEGDAILRSDQVRQQLGLDGTGVRVGVISDGIKGVFATGCTSCGGVAGGPISTGDLPSATGTRNLAGVLTSSSGGITGRSFVTGGAEFPIAGDLEGRDPGCAFAGAGAEGTALLEIIHDIAPGAKLSFANIDTDMAMNEAVNFLAASNDVVVDDFGFLAEPIDGSSPVSVNTASALNNNANPIRGYYTAVGNAADKHYFGLYANSGVSGTSISGVSTSGNLHLFQSSADTTDVLGLGPQPYNLIRLPAGGEVLVFLTWDDPFGASTNRYNLYLVRDSTNQVVASDLCVAAFGLQDPVRCVNYTNNTVVEQFFRIVVQNVQNQALPKRLNILSFAPQCATAGPLSLAPPRREKLNFNTPSRSLLAQSDAGGSPVSVVSVGAICSASPRVFGVTDSCSDSTYSTIQFFSTQGPTLDDRMKPEIAGIDGVSVTGAGQFVDPFFGTSAAAPHVAAMAALALQSAPCLLDGKSGALGDVAARTSLRHLILDNAVPLGGTVPNNTFGYGRADALASIQQTLPTFVGSPNLTISGSTPTGANVTAAQLGFADPNSCPLTTLSWAGGCGSSPGATMPCPFGTSDVSVAASNNGVSFSETASVRITVTNFSVAALPDLQTVTAGESANYTVTVSAEGWEYTNPVALACANLPAETSCAFDPPLVTPGAGAAASTLTITTTPRPAAALVLPPSLPGYWQPLARSLGVLVLIVVTLLFWHGQAGFRPVCRREVATAAALIALAGLMIQISCGGSSDGPAPRPSARLSVTSLTFAAQGVGTTSAAQPVSLSNSGNAALSIASISTNGDFGQTNNCGATLAAGGNCTINVTFTPTAGGERVGTLGVSSNASGSPHTASLSGTGLAGTAQGTYIINVTGTAGTLVNSGSVTLVVD